MLKVIVIDHRLLGSRQLYTYSVWNLKGLGFSSHTSSLNQGSVMSVYERGMFLMQKRLFYASPEMRPQARAWHLPQDCCRDKGLPLSLTDTWSISGGEGRYGPPPASCQCRPSWVSTLEGILFWLSADSISEGRNSARYAGHLPCLWLGRGHCESHKAITSILQAPTFLRESLHAALFPRRWSRDYVLASN